MSVIDGFRKLVAFPRPDLTLSRASLGSRPILVISGSDLSPLMGTPKASSAGPPRLDLLGVLLRLTRSLAPKLPDRMSDP